MFMAKGKRISPPVIRMDEVTIQLHNNIKYLGVMIVTKLNFVEHTRRTREKTARMAMTLNGTLTRQYGHNKGVIKAVIENVVKPALLYGSEVWRIKASGVFIRRHLTAAIRPSLLLVNRTYATTPTSALNVMAKIPPAWMKAQERHRERHNYKTDIDKTRITTRDKPHPPTKGRILAARTTPSIHRAYVDASSTHT